MAGTKTIAIEIDFGKSLSKEQTLILKKNLMKAIPGIETNIKEYPALPGNMGGFSPSEIVMYATIVAGVEVTLHHVLEHLLEFFSKYKTELKTTSKREYSQGIIGSIKTENERKDFIINSEGILEEWQFEPYIINPESTYAVLIGCSEYLHGIPSILPAKNNIEDLYGLLIDMRKFGLKRDNVHLLLNGASHDIQNLLYSVSHAPGIETFIFYYVGHGFTTLSNDYALAANNTEKKGDFINSGIERKFIENLILENSPAKQKIVIIDACYSGVLTQGEPLQVFNSVAGTYILTSSNSDEVSLFDKDAKNTYFTTALIDVIRYGVPTERDTISLDDLYVYTTEWLSKKKLPKPTFKSGLNIPPSAFNIANNPAFSYESELSKAHSLINQGKLSDASYIIKRLLRKFPEQQNLKELALNIDNDRMFAELVMEGDKAFLKEHDVTTAISKYQKAIRLKNDPVVKEKLNNCISQGSENPIQEIPSNLGTQSLGDEKSIDTEKKNKWLQKLLNKKVIISFLSIFLAAGTAKYLVSPTEHGETNKSSSSEQADSAQSPLDSLKENAGVKMNSTTLLKPVDEKIVSPHEENYMESESNDLSYLDGNIYENFRRNDKVTLTFQANKITLTGSIDGARTSLILKHVSGLSYTISGNDINGSASFSNTYNRITGNITFANSDVNYLLDLTKHE